MPIGTGGRCPRLIRGLGTKIRKAREGRGAAEWGGHTGACGEVDETSFNALGKEKGRREDVIRQEGVRLG